MSKTGYVNGSDILVKVGGKAAGHATNHTTTYNTETEDIAVKKPATETVSNAGLWKNKRVTALSVQIKIDALVNYDETEGSIKDVLGTWSQGTEVDVTGFERESDATPYLSGSFIISSIEHTNGANDKSSYSVTLDNNGVVTFDTAGLTVNEAAAE